MARGGGRAVPRGTPALAVRIAVAIATHTYGNPPRRRRCPPSASAHVRAHAQGRVRGGRCEACDLLGPMADAQSPHVPHCSPPRYYAGRRLAGRPATRSSHGWKGGRQGHPLADGAHEHRAGSGLGRPSCLMGARARGNPRGNASCGQVDGSAHRRASTGDIAQVSWRACFVRDPYWAAVGISRLCTSAGYGNPGSRATPPERERERDPPNACGVAASKRQSIV